MLRGILPSDSMCPQTVLSGDVYTSLSILADMMNISLELLDSPKATGQKPCSLARLVLTPNFDHGDIKCLLCSYFSKLPGLGTNPIYIQSISGSKWTVPIATFLTEALFSFSAGLIS